MLPLLVEACPSFRRAYEQFVEEWRDYVPAPIEDFPPSSREVVRRARAVLKPHYGELPLYLALTDLARHLIAMLERGETGSFTEIFSLVERLIIEGDDYVRDAAAVGLLEDLQNGGLHHQTKPEDFEPYLLPVSASKWQWLNDLWAGKYSKDEGDKGVDRA